MDLIIVFNSTQEISVFHLEGICTNSLWENSVDSEIQMNLLQRNGQIAHESHSNIDEL